jgi:hypothetical protein
MSFIMTSSTRSSHPFRYYSQAALTPEPHTQYDALKPKDTDDLAACPFSKSQNGNRTLLPSLVSG